MNTLSKLKEAFKARPAMNSQESLRNVKAVSTKTSNKSSMDKTISMLEQYKNALDEFQPNSDSSLYKSKVEMSPGSESFSESTSSNLYGMLSSQRTKNITQKDLKYQRIKGAIEDNSHES